MTAPDCRHYILREFNLRRQRNASYSLRSFARDLSVSPSTLSEVINRKAGLSPAKAVALAQGLGLEKKEATLFGELVKSAHARDGHTRSLARQNVRRQLKSGDWKIEAESFAMICDWQHLAILELATLPGGKCTLDEIMRRFRLSRTAAKTMTDRLRKLRYLSEIGDSFAATRPETVAASEVPSKAIRHYHRQVLQEAMKSIDEKPIADRSLNSVILSLNQEQFERMKEMIQKFIDEVSSEMKTKDRNQKIYCLATQFFNLENEKGFQ